MRKCVINLHRNRLFVFILCGLASADQFVLPERKMVIEKHFANISTIALDKNDKYDDLTDLSLSGNKLNGSDLEVIGHLVNLEELNLTDNSIGDTDLDIFQPLDKHIILASNSEKMLRKST